MSSEKICADCGYTGMPTRITPGHFWIEVVLWLIVIVPGVLYSLWRHLSRYYGCPVCRSPDMARLDTPGGSAPQK